MPLFPKGDAYLLEDRSHTSFVADIVILGAVICFEVFTLFIDSVVGQVHAQVAQVAPNWRHVLLSGKPRQTLLENKHSQRGNSSNQDVNPQVKLQVVNQVRLVHVSLGDIVLTRLHPVEVSRQENSFALTTGFWFDYECLGFSIVKLLLEGFQVRR